LILRSWKSSLRHTPREEFVQQARAVPGGEGAVIIAATSSRHSDASRLCAAVCDNFIREPIKADVLHKAFNRALVGRSTSQGMPLAPAHADTAPRSLGRAAPSAQIGTVARVLVVEDNLVNQHLAVKLLEKLGCNVEVAANGREAVNLNAEGSYDAIFMDCEIPEMDGFQATREIRKREGPGPSTPIIAMAAYALAGDRERCLASGMNDYIPKPVSPSALEHVLRRWTTQTQELESTTLAPAV
jgi:CheY-like chemotaxis protein